MMQEFEQVPLEQDIPESGMANADGITMFPDGSAIVPQATRVPAVSERKKTLNILPELDLNEVKRIGLRLKDAIEEDIDSQRDFNQSVANIITLLGIDAIKSAEAGLETTGNTNLISTPVLFETLRDLTATIMASVFPTQDPVTCEILGEMSPDLEDAADRKALFFNYYLQKKDKGFAKELKRIVLWSVLTGSVYCKVYIDSVLGRPTIRMIKPEDFVVNRDLSSHLSAVRKTQIHHLTRKEFELKKKTGEFLFAENIQSVDAYSDNPITEALSYISNSSPSFSSNDEGSREYKIYECHVETTISSDPMTSKLDIPLPYIVMLDSETGRVLNIARNWNPNDPLMEKKEAFVNYSCFPSLDGEGYGLMHFAGSLTQTSSEILRLILKGGTYASLPGGFISSLTKKNKSVISPQPGQFVDLETGNIPLSQAVTPLPFKEPSQILFELMKMLDDSVRISSAILNTKIADMNPNAPMGSTLAMIEQMQKIPNFILQGYHQSLTETFSLLNDCFFEWLPDQEQYPFNVPGANQVMMKSDFNPSLQVIPSCKPGIQSSSYITMLAEIIKNNAQANPNVHNMREVQKLFYKTLKVPTEEIEKILIPDNQAEPPPALDPVTENFYITSSKPVKAYVPQDHQAHIIVHKSLLQSEDIAQNQQLVGAINAHIYEHIALEQQFILSQQANIQLPGDPTQLPIDAQNQIAQMAAQVLQQQQQQQQEQQLSPEMINAQAQMVAAQAEQQMVQVKAQIAELEAQTKQHQMEIEERKLELETMKIQSEQSLKAQKLNLDTDVATERDAREAAKSELELEKGKLDLLQRSQAMANDVAL